MVNRTPPRPRQTSPSASSHPSNTGQEQKQDEDEDMIPVKPAVPIPKEPSMCNLMDTILSIKTELRDCQRQIQDLNALYIRMSSPLGRDCRNNRAPLPAMRLGMGHEWSNS